MPTTVTLEPDTRVLVERLMRERGVSFKAADAPRDGYTVNVAVLAAPR